MRVNWKSAIRIFAMAALIVGIVPSLPAAANSHENPHAAAVAQAAPAHPEKAAPAAQKHSEAAPSDAAGQEEDAADQDIQAQMKDVRRQAEQEVMNRMRYGGFTSFDRVLDQIIPFFVFVIVALAILWILRVVLDHRRWTRMVRVQTETHAKLLDKFASSQEMLAYIDSEAGKRFLEAPIFESQARQSIALPYGRILWSVQVGVIAAILGIGILLLRGKAPSPDADLGFQIFGTLTTTLGIGFLVSGGVSYALAKYMGLSAQPEEAKSRAALNS